MFELLGWGLVLWVYKVAQVIPRCMRVVKLQIPSLKGFPPSKEKL
jgi:hypothetical protein